MMIKEECTKTKCNKSVRFVSPFGLIYDGLERNPKGPGTHNQILTYYNHYCPIPKIPDFGVLRPSGKGLERNPRTLDSALHQDVRFPLFRTNHIERSLYGP